MAILQALFLALSRKAGQVVNTLFGWATQLIFGKVSQDRQIYISLMSMGSVVWLISVLGIIVPNLGAYLLTFVHLPKGINPNWIRLVMFAVALLVPLGIGLLGQKVHSSKSTTSNAVGKIPAIFHGYPYTFALAITLIMGTVFAPFLILPALVRRWTTVHVPLIVASRDYDTILAEVETVLEHNGWATQRVPASWMVRLPTKVLMALAGGIVEGLVAEKLTTLKAKDLEATLHPADLVISSNRFDAARARALLTEAVAFSRANQSWTKEANEQENRLTRLYVDWKAGVMTAAEAREQLTRAEKQRNQLQLDYEEWEVIERQHLLIERAILAQLVDEATAAQPDEERGVPVGAGATPRSLLRNPFGKRGLVREGAVDLRTEPQSNERPEGAGNKVTQD